MNLFDLLGLHTVTYCGEDTEFLVIAFRPSSLNISSLVHAFGHFSFSQGRITKEIIIYFIHES